MTNTFHRSEDGFSLVETIVAMGILATGLMTLAGVFALSLRSLNSSSPALIAREKAREAIESVHTARDTQVITWAQIQNVPDGVFVTGAQQLKLPGTDGLVNTADDTTVEEVPSPGHDGVMGTADDARIPLRDYSREIVITRINNPDGSINPFLRQVQVIIRYSVGGAWRTYTLTTFISSIA